MNVLRTDQERFPQKNLNMKTKGKCPKGRLTLRLERKNDITQKERRTWRKQGGQTVTTSGHENQKGLDIKTY
jgi:hypothetical protein